MSGRYYNLNHIDSVTHHGVTIDICEAIKAPECCGVEQDLEPPTCMICGQPLRPQEVTVFFYEDAELFCSDRRLNLEDARGVAQSFVDHSIDRIDDWLKQSEETIEEMPLVIIEEEPAGYLESGDPDDPDHPSLFDAPISGSATGGNDSHDRLQKLMRRMEKLGWPAKALAIIQEEGKKG